MKQLLTIFLALSLLGGCTAGADRSRMRSGLDSINQRNRNDQPFTVADVQPYADFFDRHGTSNDRLLAHYLLGRAYYEAGEAPMALQCYQQAIECADTTAKDCDFAQLCRVYAQKSDLFYYQGLYREAIHPIENAAHYADLSGDSLVAVMCYEQLSFIYDALNIPDSAILVMEKAANRYNELGHESDAAISLGSIARSLILTGKLEKASRYMHIYESESGFFDKDGFIQSGREAYYNSKGLLYLKKEQLDSAKFWFRKEMTEGHDFNNQNGGAYGLAIVYAHQHRYDSAAHLFRYAYDMNDSIHAQRNSDVVERLQAMYDYTRNQEIARKESEEASAANKSFYVCLIVLLVIALAASWLYFARKQIIEVLKETSSELHTVRLALANMQRSNTVKQQDIIEKEKRIKQLEKKLGRYGKIVYFGAKTLENNLMLSPNFQRIQQIAYKGQVLSTDDWNVIRQLFTEYLPACYDVILSKLIVDTIEYQICLLLRLHFKAGEVANMLDVTPAYVSKISSEIIKLLFDKKGSSRELSKELCKLI